MGKRKERRLAAMSATNRRVKLDLFAEPSEEMCNSSKEDVGGNQGHDHSASPSSSGQNKENPLLLLGQYSDDELDDEANKQQKEADTPGYSSGSEDKEKELADLNEELEDYKEEVAEAHSYKPKPDQSGSSQALKTDGTEPIESISIDVNLCETELVAQTCVSEQISENNENGHVRENWKLVLHGESNNYYYWNTVTGETSWEVPPSLAIDPQNRDEQDECIAIAGTGNVTDSSVDMGIYGHVLSTDGHGSSTFISKDTEEFESMELKSRKVSDASTTVEQYCTNNVTASHNNLSEYSTVVEHPGLHHHALNNEQKDIQSDNYVGSDAHFSQLVLHAESLLQRLDMLHSSAQLVEGYEGIRKEIDIRISDCRALSSYGSTLLPFWWHIEVQLKQIESTINKSEASTVFRKEESSNLNVIAKSLQTSSYAEVTDEDQTIIVTSESGTKTENDNSENLAVKTEFQLFQGSEHPRDEIVPESNPNPNSSNSAPIIAVDADDDMDVEMEVDEEILLPAAASMAICSSPSEPPPSLFPNEPYILPPPEEEWIPPPPPDVEPLPPPPPPSEFELDLPKESSAPFTSSYAETMLYTFPDQYGVGYHIPTYDYYSSTANQNPNGDYYGIASGSQLVESEPSAYYEPTAPTTLPEASSSITTVASSAYYDVANVPISSANLLSSTEPSVFYVESSAVNYYQDAAPPDSLSSCQASTLQSSSEAYSSLDAQLATAPKNQSKVTRSKKRPVAVAPTLRLNKKVSSLVDKWMAAKEELHGEEQEPEDPLEVLEKKRQKEIEDWRARQVATGEAQDNANFVPLGGDWRERVKRRARSRSSDDAATSAATAAEREKKQPDLAELSKDLPNGWQVYWDESTKQVYYGNYSTSETTWNRPTR